MNKHERVSPYDDPFPGCFCCPCSLVFFIMTGIRRCIFVACNPIVQCFRLDDHKHPHRHFY